LAARGHEPVLALRNIVEPAPLLQDAGFAVLQAPFWPPRPQAAGTQFRAASFADILALQWGGPQAELLSVLAAWDQLLALVRPDAVLAHYAPNLCLAGFGHLPLAVFGDGFSTPPGHLPRFPRLQRDAAPLLPEAALLDRIAAAQAKRGRPAPDGLPALFAGRQQYVCSFPEVDPYAALRATPSLPPLQDLPPPVPPPAEPYVFAYLNGDLGWVTGVLRGLVAAGVPGGVYLRKPTPEARQILADGPVELFETLQPLPAMLRRASLLLHHASLGMTNTGLTAGRPQLLLPHDLDKGLLAQALLRLGVGRPLVPDAAADGIAELLAAMVSDTALAARAMDLAHALDARGPRDAAATIAAGCEAILS
jgi:hypothetical protein